MHKLRRFDITKSREIYQRVIDFVDEIALKLPVTTVYLYGSLARGDVHEGSDIDLLIIGNFKENFFERILAVMHHTTLPIEPLVYTLEEFAQMKARQNPFILEVLEKGEKIFDSSVKKGEGYRERQMRSTLIKKI